MRKPVVVVFSVIVLVLLGTVAWLLARPQAVAPQAVSSEATVAVSAVPVQTKELIRTTRLSGNVAPWQDVTALARVGGTVQWVVGDIGTVVQGGDPLVRLDDHDLRLQLRQAEAVYAQAEAALERMRKGASDEEQKQAEASVSQAEAGFQLAEESLQRADFLFREGVIARDALDAARSQHTMARSQLEVAEQLLAQVKRGARAEEMRAGEAQLAQAQVAVELAQKQLADAEIKAPISGHVALRHTQVGALLGPGSPVYTLVAIDDVLVQVGVTDRLVNALRPGDEVQVSIQALPQYMFSGAVVAVSPVADPQTRLFPVRIKVANPDHHIKPGMVASLDAAVERTAPVPVVPQSAVVHKGGGTVIYVVQADGIVEERPVTLGLSSGEWIQVDRATDGELVVTSRHGFLSEGVKVRVEREAP